jgi:phytoene dehydrogenase-like protein
VRWTWGARYCGHWLELESEPGQQVGQRGIEQRVRQDSGHGTLAKMGARVVIVEARGKTGGAADTSTPFPDHPDVRVTTLSYVMSPMPPALVRDLRLKSFGYKVFPMGPAYAPQPGGGAIRLTPAKDELRGRLARFSRRDADAFGEWAAWLERAAALLGPVLMETPPKVGSTAPGDVIDQVRFILRRRRSMSARQAADVTKLARNCTPR